MKLLNSIWKQVGLSNIFFLNTGFYLLNKRDIFTGYYFHTEKISNVLFSHCENNKLCDVMSDMYCMQCPRNWNKYAQKTKEYVTIGPWIWNLLHSCKYQKLCLTCEINSIFNVKPFNIIYLSPLGRGCGPSFEKNWIFFHQGCFELSLVEIGQVILEKKSKT